MGQKKVCPVEPGEVNNRWLENQERLTTGWQGILTPRNPLKTHLPAYSWGGRGCRAGTNSPETRDNKGTSQQGKSRLHHLHTLGWIWTLLKEVSIPLSERSAAVGAASLSLPSYILRCVDSFSILATSNRISGREREVQPSTSGQHNGHSMSRTTTVPASPW